MRLIPLILILALSLLASCAQPQVQTTQPGLAETQPVAGGETIAPSDTPAATNTPEPSPTLVPPTLTVAPTETPTSVPEQPTAWVVYTGQDGNLWLVNPASGEERQLTQDANPLGPGSQADKTVIGYCCAQWAPAGDRLVYRRETGKPLQSGFDYQFSLWIYDLTTGEAKPLVENEQLSGYAWQPGSDIIAYGRSIPIEYFLNRSPEMAQGIWAVDAGTGETTELVKPERGYSLSNPQWSPDGRFLSFEEVEQMEGRGTFAYYDFEAQKYIAWEDVIGSYSWSPDGEQLAYDRMAYVPQGSERIWLRDRQGGDERAITPQYDPGYAFNPLFSPQGDRLAYFASLGGIQSEEITLFVMSMPDGEPQNLGTFRQAGYLSWAADGSDLILTEFTATERQVLVVDAVTGESRVLAQGSEADWQPVSGQ